MAYINAVSQLKLIHRYNDQISQNEDASTPPPALDRVMEVLSLIGKHVEIINTTHLKTATELSLEERALFFGSATFFQQWNQRFDLRFKISNAHSLKAESKTFPATLFHCSYITPQLTPLVVETKEGWDVPTFTRWAKTHQNLIQEELKQHGALAMDGLPMTKELFPEVFEAIIGHPHRSYKGAVPRAETVQGKSVYTSSATNPSHKIPGHQELSYETIANKPKHIAFFCEIPPQPGTGETFLIDVKSVTNVLQTSHQDIWDLVNQHTFTYEYRYLADSGLRTWWTQLLNPSHANVSRRFRERRTDEKTVEDYRSNIEKENPEYTFVWENGEVTVSKNNIPGVIKADGMWLYCWGGHLDLMSPELVGGKFKYMMARTLLYPTLASMQFNVKRDDGTPIAADIPGRILKVLESLEIVFPWKQNRVLLIKNETMMHGKNPHSGPRALHAIMD